MRFAVFLLMLVVIGCDSQPRTPLAAPLATTEARRPATPTSFEDVTEEVGVDFVHSNGGTGEFYFHEIMGSGAALFDFDRDGDLDLYLVQGALATSALTGTTSADSLPGSDAEPLRDRLYRNDLEITSDGSRRLAFTDVTDASLIHSRGFGMAVATGDIDNDGWVDLFVTHFGANELWRNRGDGTFEEIGEGAGVADPRWSIPATFVDYDRDGHLDLFVGHYVAFSLANHKRCLTQLGAPNYCGPFAYAPEVDSLYRNRGDGTFEDVTVRAGLAQAPGGALGVVAADLDQDGWTDLYVANDGMPNHLWRSRGDGTFEDEGLLSGTALNELGQAEASMGVVAADFDRDGDDELFVTHLGLETNTFYVNGGEGSFLDRSDRSRLGAPSSKYTGFGVSALDVDNDSWLDLLVVNGAVRVIEELNVEGDDYPFHEPDLLFLNREGSRFEEIAATSEPTLARSTVSRGVATGDLDNDGDADILATTNNGPARVLRNRVGSEAAWLGLELFDRFGRPPLGARVGVPGPEGEVHWGRVSTDGSYASASDPRLLFGLGSSKLASTGPILVHWPEGRWERFDSAPLRQYSILVQGDGEVVDGP